MTIYSVYRPFSGGCLPPFSIVLRNFDTCLLKWPSSSALVRGSEGSAPRFKGLDIL